MKQYSLAFIGFIIIAFGVSMTIHVSDVGLEPWSAALLGLSSLCFTYGVWNMIIHSIFISLTLFIEKRPPRLGTLINMMAVGPLIDLFVFLDLFPKVEHMVGQYIFFIVGVVIASFGASLLIISNMGAGSKTQFYVTLHEKTKWKLAHCKNIVECMGLFLAFLVGGPLFIGTIVFIFVSSYSLQFFVQKMKKQTI